MAFSCPAPDPGAGLVYGLLGSVDCNINGFVELGYGALARPGSQVSLMLTSLLTLYIAFMGLRYMLGTAPLRIGDLTITLVKIGVVLALATSWPTYQQLVIKTLFNGPEEILTSVLSAARPTDSAFAGSPFEGLQVAYAEMQVQAQYFAERSNAVMSPFVGGNAFGAFAMNIASMIMLLATLGVTLAAKIVLGLLLGLGPIFAGLLLFDATRGIFEGWLKAALGLAVVPLFVLLTLVVDLILIEPHLVRMAELRAVNEVDLAPAIAVLMLTIISAGVSMAGVFAALKIASGVRLARPAPAAAKNGGEADRTNHTIWNQHGTAALQPRADSIAPERAAAIASAVSAAERRDARSTPAHSTPDPSRTPTVRDRGTTDIFYPPIGQNYRRSSKPRLSASGARRDR